MDSILLSDRKFLITGVRNKWSIAWCCVLALQRAGAQLYLSVLTEREEDAAKKLLAEAGIDAPVMRCDATNDEDVTQLMTAVSDHFGGQFDGLLHAIAFAKKEDLGGDYVDTSKEGFNLAHEASVYSLVALAKGARAYLVANGGGSIVTLTYIGAERAVPNYNVMGVAKASLEASVRYLASDMGKEAIRVNAVSAGPIKTLAASAIADFDSMRKQVAEVSPLRRAVTADEVGDTVAFLLSSLARGITGEVIYVDGGFHIAGMA